MTPEKRVDEYNFNIWEACIGKLALEFFSLWNCGVLKPDFVVDEETGELFAEDYKMIKTMMDRGVLGAGRTFEPGKGKFIVHADYNAPFFTS